MANRFSVASYSFHGLLAAGAMNLFHYFETVRYRYNLDTADIWNGMLASYEEGYLELVKQQMEEHGLQLVNLCCDGAHIWNQDEAQKAACDRRAQECLRAAELLGAQTVRIDTLASWRRRPATSRLSAAPRFTIAIANRRLPSAPAWARKTIGALPRTCR